MSTSEVDLNQALLQAILALNSQMGVKPESRDYESSLLHVRAYGIAYSSSRPYATPWAGAWAGTAFVLQTDQGKKIITNAHVGGDTTYLEVQFSKDDPKHYPAKLIKLGRDCDLALLDVEDQEFWKKAKALELAEKDAKVRDPVSIYGFPIGGRNISITNGEVSRREERHHYAHSDVQLPIEQVTAAVNPGNSGGPALSKGKVIGVAFQGLRGVDAGGQIIPLSVLKHFIEDQNSIKHRGFPGLSFKHQNISKSQRTRYGLSDQQTGIRIVSADKTSSAYDILKEDDILLEIDGQKINDDGTIKLDDGRMENFRVLISKKYLGDLIDVKLLRNGKIISDQIQLKNPIGDTLLVQSRFDSEQDTFFWHSACLFQVVTKNLLEAGRNFFGSNIPTSIMNLEKQLKEDERHQAIMLNQILPTRNTMQIRQHRMQLIKSINGKEIREMHDVLKALQANPERTHLIHFENGKEIEVNNLPSEEQAALLLAHGIYVDRSRDLEDLDFSDFEFIEEYLPPKERKALTPPRYEEEKGDDIETDVNRNNQIEDDTTFMEIESLGQENFTLEDLSNESLRNQPTTEKPSSGTPMVPLFDHRSLLPSQAQKRKRCKEDDEALIQAEPDSEEALQWNAMKRYKVSHS